MSGRCKSRLGQVVFSSSDIKKVSEEDGEPEAGGVDRLPSLPGTTLNPTIDLFPMHDVAMPARKARGLREEMLSLRELYTQMFLLRRLFFRHFAEFTEGGKYIKAYNAVLRVFRCVWGPVSNWAMFLQDASAEPLSSVRRSKRLDLFLGVKIPLPLPPRLLPEDVIKENTSTLRIAFFEFHEILTHCARIALRINGSFLTFYFEAMEASMLFCQYKIGKLPCKVLMNEDF